VGLRPTPRKLFEKSLIKNFKGMRVAHSGDMGVGLVLMIPATVFLGRNRSKLLVLMIMIEPET